MCLITKYKLTELHISLLQGGIPDHLKRGSTYIKNSVSKLMFDVIWNKVGFPSFISIQEYLFSSLYFDSFYKRLTKIYAACPGTMQYLDEQNF